MVNNLIMINNLMFNVFLIMIILYHIHHDINGYFMVIKLLLTIVYPRCVQDAETGAPVDARAARPWMNNIQ